MMAELEEDSSSLNEDNAVCYLVDPENFDGVLQDGSTILYSGQTVQLEDGSTAFLQPGVGTENLHEVTLEDGTTAYIALGVSMLNPLELETAPSSEDAVELGDSLQNTIESDDTDEAKYVYRFVELGEENGEGDIEEVEVDDDSSRPDMKDPISVPSETSSTARTSTTSTSTASTSTAKPTKTFVCEEEGCGKKYSAHHHLKVHVRCHTGSRPFKCVQADCKKMFRTNYALKAHVRTHTGEKPYKCPFSDCGKSFKTSGDLQKHIRTHTGERPFQCPVPGCDRAFTTSNIRKVHLRTHTGERPYECTVPNCNRAFASATNYKNHMRIHSGEKPYVCANKSCGRRFTEYSSLYKHQTVHTQNKPYECQECGRHYRQSSTLTMHRRTAHNIIQTVDGTEVMLALPLPLSLQSASGKLDSYAFVEVERDSEDCVLPIEEVRTDSAADASMNPLSDSDDTSHLDDSSLTQILVVDDKDGLLAVECFDDEHILN